MSTLSNELANDPQGLGYQTHISAGDHQSVTAIINEPRYSTVGGRRISSTELLMWGAQAGRIARLEDAAANSQLGADVRSIASAALRMVQRSDTGLDLSDAQEVAMIDALVQATVFTADDKSSLEALSTADISRAEQIGLGRVTLAQIREAV
ncbi:hypothetical protein [Sediminicurvatus halobius]|uniref:Uncharacterized protein n=1 Tax=Sediminicurvatus halobius TaxID=2182432 RepID=A0A2U2MY62_9GAMM|nr:hypothetical protein [Spiribacter halobius]PWG61757.1 hypothetical protein DEM34_14930 [Spiribacter halobius]UEX76810.1 hypothetical protein LMH63_12680 [Spiribacter halobius]